MSSPSISDTEDDYETYIGSLLWTLRTLFSDLGIMCVLFYVCMHNVLEFVVIFVTFTILQVKNHLGLMA